MRLPPSPSPLEEITVIPRCGRAHDSHSSRARRFKRTNQPPSGGVKIRAAPPRDPNVSRVAEHEHATYKNKGREETR